MIAVCGRINIGEITEWHSDRMLGGWKSNGDQGTFNTDKCHKSDSINTTGTQLFIESIDKN